VAAHLAHFLGTTNKQKPRSAFMRRISLQLLAATSLSFIGAHAVSAADLSVPYKASPVASVNWTGCYIGAEGGGGFQVDSFTGKWGVGGFGGGVLGCNYQINSFVVGVEGEGFGSGLRTRADLTVLIPGGATTTSSETTRAFYDVAVRMGYTFFDRTLIYWKLGAVWSDQNYTLTGTGGTINSSWTTPGVLIGGGFDYALTSNWTARFETDLLLFDSTDATFLTTGGFLPTHQTVNTLNLISKVGLTYKFF